MHTRWLVGILACLGACISAPCSSHCKDSVELDASVNGSATAIARVSLCMNALCGVGDVASNSAVLTGDIAATAQLSENGPSTRLVIRVYGGNGSHHDGDVYHVVAYAADGTPLLDATKSVQYTVHEGTCDDCLMVVTSIP